MPMKTIHQMKKDKEDALLKKREEAERKVKIIVRIEQTGGTVHFLKVGVLVSGNFRPFDELAVFELLRRKCAPPIFAQQYIPLSVARFTCFLD